MVKEALPYLPSKRSRLALPYRKPIPELSPTKMPYDIAHFFLTSAFKNNPADGFGLNVFLLKYLSDA